MRVSASSPGDAAAPHAASRTMSTTAFVAPLYRSPGGGARKSPAARDGGWVLVLWTPAMRMPGSCLVAGLVVLAVARAAPAGDAPGAFAPYEDLLEVLADLTWHLRDDVYRFPPPKDPTGHDV